MHVFLKKIDFRTTCPPPTFDLISCTGLMFTQISAHPEASFVWLMEYTHGVQEAQSQAPCISEVRNFL